MNPAVRQACSAAAPRRHLIALIIHRKGMQLVNGTALTGRLMKSADVLGVEIRVSTPAIRLLTDDDGRVSGAVVGSPGVGKQADELRINASRGVVQATGGFPNDVDALFKATPEGAAVQSWQIADAGVVRRFPLGIAKPLPVPWFPSLAPAT